MVHRVGNELPHPGWRASRAWRILRKAADAGDQNAIEAVWQAWLRHPDEERWELLTGWREPRDLTEAGSRDDAAPLTAEETGYVVRQLAAHADWAGLWRLVPDFPLAEAVAAMRHFPGAWRPADEAGQRLFALLTGGSKEAVRALRAQAVTRIRADGITGVRFAPDDSQIVVGGWQQDAVATSYALPGGDLAGRYPGASVHRFACLGEVVAYVKLRRGHMRCEVIRHGKHDRERLWTGLAAIVPSVVQVPGGFAINLHDQVMFGTARPWTLLREIPVDLGPGVTRTYYITGLASDPASGRLAVVFRRTVEQCTLAVLDADFRLIGRAQFTAEGMPQAHFCGPGVLVVQSGPRESHLDSWQVGPPLIRAASIDVGDYSHIAPWARTGLIALRPVHGPVTWLDAGTLALAENPAARFDAKTFWASPTGDHVAIPDGRDLEVRDLRLDAVAELLTRPLATARPADLAAVMAVPVSGLGAEARSVIGLLRACLEYRFGAEVAIGPATAADGPDDIALHTGDDRPC